jgi:hypothetical protein
MMALLQMEDNGREDDAFEIHQGPDVPSQSRFRVAASVDEGALTSAPLKMRYFEWSIVTNPTDIDGGQDEDVIADLGGTSSSEESGGERREWWEPESMENEDNQPNHGPNEIDDLDDSRRTPNLKGYEYTTFNPTPLNHHSPGSAEYMPHPMQPDVLAAMEDLKKILHPSRLTGRG